jgi:hypothetical protein
LKHFRTNNPHSPVRKNFKGPQYPELDEILKNWVYHQRSCQRVINNKIIAEKAKEFFAILYNAQEFKSSAGFVSKFCRRYGFRTVKQHSESNSANREEASNFVQNTFPGITRTYSKEQIYNADEFGLQYCELPTNTIATPNEKKVSGFKQDMRRVTMLACANAAGSHKLRLAFIHKSANPRCFKSISKADLPVYYNHSSSSWMTASIFSDWFHNEFVVQVRSYLQQIGLEQKAILLIDNCKAHPKGLTSTDGKIRCIFLPANTTSLIQPMDQGPISLFKRCYRSSIVKDIIERDSSIQAYTKFLHSNILFVIRRSAAIWNNISQTSLMSSWHNLKCNLEVATEEENFNLPDIINYFARLQLDESSVLDWFNNVEEEDGEVDDYDEDDEAIETDETIEI